MARPAHRDYLGAINTTVGGYNHLELALDTNSRSGDQFDIWQAVYSPVGEDGYPAPIWDKLSGDINPEVAEYWRENYDLRHIMERDWKTLGPKLEGKIYIYRGDQENPNHVSRLRYNSMYLPKILKRIEASAPEGADLTSWRY